MRTYGHVAAIGGIFGCIVLSAPSGGLSLVGAAAIGLTWVVTWTSSRDREKQYTGGGRKMSNNLPVVGTRYPLRSYEDVPSPILWSGSTPTSPESVLAGTDPRLAARVLERMSLDRTHESIVAPAAAEFARQGRGTRATTRRVGGFFGGDGVETTIRPL